MVLSKGELYLLYEDWVEESCINPGVVLAKAEQDIRSLLLHINAQDEALADCKAALTLADNISDCQTRAIEGQAEALAATQAEAASMREALGHVQRSLGAVLDYDDHSHSFAWEERCYGPHEALQMGKDALSGTAGQAMLDELVRLQAVAETAMGCDKALAAWVNVRVAEASADHSAEALAATHLAYKQLLDKGIATREALAALGAKEESNESDDGS